MKSKLRKFFLTARGMNQGTAHSEYGKTKPQQCKELSVRLSGIPHDLLDFSKDLRHFSVLCSTHRWPLGSCRLHSTHISSPGGLSTVLSSPKCWDLLQTSCTFTNSLSCALFMVKSLNFSLWPSPFQASTSWVTLILQTLATNMRYNLRHLCNTAPVCWPSGNRKHIPEDFTSMMLAF